MKLDLYYSFYSNTAPSEKTNLTVKSLILKLVQVTEHTSMYRDSPSENKENN